MSYFETFKEAVRVASNDITAGNAKIATIEKWLTDNKLENKTKTISIHFEGSMVLVKKSLVYGWNSLYYQDKCKIPVLEIEVDKPGVLTTEFSWSL